MHMPSSVLGGGLAHRVTSSTIVAEPSTGSHVLKIDGYSRIKGLGNDRFITSEPFDVGGHPWIIMYYPLYPGGKGMKPSGRIGLFLHLDHNPIGSTGVQASWEISLLNHVGVQAFRFREDKARTFRDLDTGWSFGKFINQKTLEESDFLKDYLRIRCDVTVWTAVRSGSLPRAVTVPPSDMHQHMCRLLESQVGSDVTIEVGEEAFAAHRAVLAARSPVFMAQLFGQMKEGCTSRVRIDDMEPRVFRAMLHFVYTDSLPADVADDRGSSDAMAMSQHLAVAADKYGMERLRLICEDRLCDYIDTSTAATTLVLAEQHGFSGLKDACFKFLKSPGNLKAIMDNDEFQHISNRCPSLISELLANVAP